MELDLATTAFVTLFVIIDPIGLAPMFVALTRGMGAAQRRVIALRACLVGAGVLAVFGFAGEFVLSKVGISMPAFRISGGILLFLTALEMLFERRSKRREQSAEADPHPDPSVFPLGMPLIAGPGAMTSMILLVGQQSGEVTGQVMVYAVMLAVVAITLIFFLMAAPIEKALGHTGTNIITRLLGMFLAALAVQFVLDGLRDFGLMGGA